MVGVMVVDVVGVSIMMFYISEVNLKLIWFVFEKVLVMKIFVGKEKVFVLYLVFVEKG